MGRGFRGSHGFIAPFFPAESTVVFNHSHPVDRADDPNASVCPASTIHGAVPPPARRLRLRVARTPTFTSPNRMQRLSTRASGAHRGVPGSTLCLRCLSSPASRRRNADPVPGSLFTARGRLAPLPSRSSMRGLRESRARELLALTGACRARHCAGNDPSASCLAPHNADAGQPPRYTVPVRPSTPRGRPPASHRRGRSPLPPPPRDRADGTTLGGSRHQPRRTRRPALRDATKRGPSPPTGIPNSLADTRHPPQRD